MATMLAGRLQLDPRKLVLREIPVPEPGPGQVRVKVEAAGVCLSDVHLIDGSLTPQFAPGPEITLGHEVAGVIDAIGPGVPGDWHEGDRVALQAGERCGECADCVRFREPCLRSLTRGVDYDGGWAEYTLARQHTLVALPDGLPFDQAAIVPDAVSTPWGAITGTGRVEPGRPAGVWGVGGLGAHAVQLLRLVGAAPIVAVDPLPAARERALQFGADVALDATAEDLVRQVRAATGGPGLDVAFDMAGVPAVREQALDCVRPGGKLVLVGIAAEPLTIRHSVALNVQRKQILGHYGYGADAVETLVGLIRHHRLDLSRSISGHFPLAEAADAVDRLERKKGDPIRFILQP